MLQLLPFLETEALHDSGHPISRAEVAHEIVFEADVKSRTAGIALARATPAQLSIYPASFVPLGADHHQTARCRYARTELNVGAAAGHVGRNRDCPRLTSTRDDLRLLHMIFGVQHVVRNFFAFEHSAEQLSRL